MSSGLVIDSLQVFNPAFIRAPTSVRATTVSAESVVSGTANFTAPVTMAVATVNSGGIVPNSTSVANTAYVDSKIAALVNGAPAALDTLKELADAIASNPGYSGSITTLLTSKANLAGGNTFTGTQSMPAITLNGVDLDTRIAAAEGVNTSQGSTLTSHASRLTSAESDITTAQGDITDLEAAVIAKGVEIDSLEVRTTALEVHDVVLDASLSLIDGRVATNTTKTPLTSRPTPPTLLPTPAPSQPTRPTLRPTPPTSRQTPAT